MAGEQQLRIGELSKRADVSPELLRAWERRYGLLRPTRSPGGLRLYSLDDLERVRAMRRHLAAGLAAAEAAEAVSRDGTAAESPTSATSVEMLGRELAEALDGFDEPRAQMVFDRLLATATVDTLLADVVLPYLRELGTRWEGGETSIAQEHFASSVLRGRLLGLARGWGLGAGPVALLACLPEEQHDLGLISFGLVLRARGWRIVYLGADAPIETINEACRRINPALAVLSGVSRERLRPALPQLRELAAHHRVALGGVAARPSDADEFGLLPLMGEPVAEAERITTLVDSDMTAT